MAQINKSEINKLAKLSLIELTDQKAAKMVNEIGAILTYASKLQDIIIPENLKNLPHNYNVTRKDIVIITDSNKILEEAPSLEDRYFEVPAIIS